MALRKIRSVAIGDKFCLLPTAEVLTDKGWVALQDLDISTVKVATMDPQTFALSYVQASDKYEFDYNSKTDGKLYYVKGDHIHTICTPTHKNYVKRCGRNSYELIEAKNCIDKTMKFKRNCNNEFREAPRIILKDTDNVAHTYPMNAYLRLLGMFISDGYVSGNVISFSMQKQRKLDFMNNISDEMGISFHYYDRYFRIAKGTLPGIYEEFKRLSIGARNKRIPKYIWNLGKTNCRELLEGLMNGDGHKEKNKKRWKYITVSPGLADDIQKLCLHAGLVCNIHLVKTAGRQNIIRGQIVTTNYDTYVLSIMQARGFEPEKSSTGRHISQEEKEIDYKGKVMCIEVPETHLFYYRENQLSPPLWTGNSSRAGQKGKKLAPVA